MEIKCCSWGHSWKHTELIIQADSCTNVGAISSAMQYLSNVWKTEPNYRNSVPVSKWKIRDGWVWQIPTLNRLTSIADLQTHSEWIQTVSHRFHSGGDKSRVGKNGHFWPLPRPPTVNRILLGHPCDGQSSGSQSEEAEAMVQNAHSPHCWSRPSKDESSPISII